MDIRTNGENNTEIDSEATELIIAIICNILGNIVSDSINQLCRGRK